MRPLTISHNRNETKINTFSAVHNNNFNIFAINNNMNYDIL